LATLIRKSAWKSAVLSPFTVNEVNGEEFGVFVIPHTLAVTHWKAIKPGAEVNLEVDLMARYAARLAEKSPAL